MVIRNMTASFGKLQGDRLELQPGLNFIEAPNESGKSTWCAFLHAMLYGVDSTAREKGGVMPEKVKYAPWSGAPMEGAMELEWQGKDLTLTRKTGQKNAPMREFSAVYTGTGLPVNELTGRSAGELLTGVPEEVFVRSAFIRQGEVAVSGSPELEKRIASLVCTGEEDTSFSDASETLKAWQRKRKRTLERLNQEEMTRQAERSAASELQQARDLAAEQLRQAEQTVAQLREQSDQLRRQQRKDALHQMTENKNRMKQASGEYDAAKQQAEETARRLTVGPFAGMDGARAMERAENDVESARRWEKESRRKFPLPVGILLLLAAVFAALGIFRQPMAFAGAAVCAGAAVGAYQILRKNARQAEEKLHRLLESYGVSDSEGLSALAEEYAADYKAWQRAVARMETAKSVLDREYAKGPEREEAILGALDFETGLSAAASAGRQLKQAEERVSEYRQRLAKLDGKLENTPGGGYEPESNGQRQQLTEEMAAIDLALRTLNEADEEIQRVFAPKLNARASEIFREFTDGAYTAVALDRNFTAQTQTAGAAVTRRAGYLSGGAWDLLYLAVRLAICELVLPADCPIVLDDSLVNLDARRRAAVLDYLKKMAQTRQVIVFACSGTIA